LLADDDPDFARVLSEVLRERGYRVDHVSSAAAARAALDEGRYDVLLSDIHMPGNDGLSLLRHVANQAPDLPVIVITAYPSTDTAVGALRLRAVDYLEKPFEYGDLFARLDVALERGQRDRAMTRFVQAAREVSRQAEDPAAAAAALADELDELSERERELVEELLRGRRIRQIANTMDISVHTARNHLQSVFRKLGVHSQEELVERLRAPG
jgi:DNA-binding NarL/FixJ family response regulator